MPSRLLRQVLDPSIRRDLPSGTLLEILLLVYPLDDAVEQVIVLVNVR